MQKPNPLFPIFLKLDQIQTLIVGGGYVGHEKLSALLKNDNQANVMLVAPFISEAVKLLAGQHPSVRLNKRPFHANDLIGVDLVIVATDNPELNQEIKLEARRNRILVNVADTPDLCDFYLGSTVTKGALKIGISTNGQSPTFAKRLRELLEETLPEETDALLQNLKAIRNRLKGDFAYKVNELNILTSTLLEKKED